MHPIKRWTPILCLLVAATAAAAQPPRLDEALRIQSRKVENNPGDAGLLNDLGNLLYLAERTEEAEEAYRQAVQQAPDDVQARHNLALLLHETGRQRSALRHTKSVLKREPGHAWAHYHAGMLYEEKGRRSRAVRHYAEALALDSRLRNPVFNPHIIENGLADSATLTAYLSTSPAALAPRSFDKPKRVAGMFLPSLRKARAEERGALRRLRRQRSTGTGSADG